MRSFNDTIVILRHSRRISTVTTLHNVDFEILRSAQNDKEMLRMTRMFRMTAGAFRNDNWCGRNDKDYERM